MTPFTARRLLWVIVAVGVLACPEGGAASAYPHQKEIDAVFAAYDRTGSPGCAVAVLHRGRVVHLRGYGQAHLEWDAPITPATVFHVASLSKQFTALGVVLLAEEGNLSLDDDVRKYVPELPDYGKVITIRHLLQHTSGLPDVWEMGALAGWRPGDLVTERDVLGLAFRQNRLDYHPGERHVYGNVGYTLAALIVRRVSGRSLRDYTDTHIFKPLGMKNTHFHDNHRAVVRNRAAAYRQREDRFEIAVPAIDAVGSTGLFSTVEDLTIWDQNFYARRVGKSAIDQALKPGKLNSGKEVRYGADQSYGLGLVIGTYRGLKTVGHSGADGGYRAEYLQFPEHQFSVIILGNVHTLNPSFLAREVADLCLGKEFPVAYEPGKKPAPPKAFPVTLSRGELAACVGTYWNLRTGESWAIRTDEGKLLLGRIGRAGGRELTPLATDRFRISNLPITLHFRAATDASPRTMTWVDVEPVEYVALPELTLSKKELTVYTGSYWSAQLQVEYNLILSDGELVVQGGRDRYGSLRPVIADGFSLEAPSLPSAFLRFTRGGDEQVSGFTLSTERCRAIGFVKRKKGIGGPTEGPFRQQPDERTDHGEGTAEAAPDRSFLPANSGAGH